MNTQTLDKLPRRKLGFFPTPLIELERLSGHLGGPRILMKRDDQTGRAMGALLSMIESGEFSSDETVLFWHTGGAPALFSCPEKLAEL